MKVKPKTYIYFILKALSCFKKKLCINYVFFSALELLKNAIGKAGYTDKIVIGMDVAASEFYKGGKYDLDFKSPDDPSRYISPDQLADLYKSFVKDYPGQCLWSLVLLCVRVWYSTTILRRPVTTA